MSAPAARTDFSVCRNCGFVGGAHSPSCARARRAGRRVRTFPAKPLHYADVPSQMVEITAGPNESSYGRLYPGGQIILGIASTAAAHLFAKVVAR